MTDSDFSVPLEPKSGVGKTRLFCGGVGEGWGDPWFVTDSCPEGFPVAKPSQGFFSSKIRPLAMAKQGLGIRVC